MNKWTQESFYKSKEWLRFRQIVIEENTNDQGFILCAKCGKPILKKYDLIVHHKKELDDLNVNDVAVSLNPDNVECICFRCHNEEHERFGFNKTSFNVQKKVFIVYGSPCSGKSTWVHDVATQNDLIVDLDNIWQMISCNDKYIKPAALKSVVFQMRDALYDVIKYRSGKWHNAFIITGGALKGDRDRLQQRVGADELIFIDTAQSVCLERIQTKGLPDELKDQWKDLIINWFNTFQPEEQ